MQRLRNSWALTKASWGVLMADKELLLLPIVSFLATAVVWLTIAIPMLLSGMVDAFIGIPFLSYIVLFLFYLALYSVSIFTNAAIVGMTHIRLKGGDPTLGDGFRIAFAHSGSILGYAAISATVGLVLQAISERSNTLGRIVASLLGAGWSIVTFLVIPVLVIEGVGPVDGIKRSVHLLKTTWGEQIAGNLGLGFVFGLIYGAVAVLTLPLFAMGIALQAIPLLVLAGVLMVVGFMAVGMLQTTLQGIYTAAVYQYATTGEAGKFFDPDIVMHAFKESKK
jgi:hypothetical protein